MAWLWKGCDRTEVTALRASVISKQSSTKESGGVMEGGGERRKKTKTENITKMFNTKELQIIHPMNPI